MRIIKLKNMVKNGKQLGFYLYMPIVAVNDEFFWCESIKSRTILKPKDIDVNNLVVKRLIPQEFHEPNGLVTNV